MKQLPITPKEQEILDHLFRFRFLTRLHTQTLLHHKDHRPINRWLTDLVHKNYITRIHGDNYIDRSKPAIYHLSPNGLRYLRSIGTYEPKYLNTYKQERRKSPPFRKISLCIVDIYLKLMKKNYGNAFKFFTTSDLPVNSIIRKLRPSCGFTYENKSVICEIFQKEDPIPKRWGRIKKCVMYIEERLENNTPYMLFISEDETLHKSISRILRKICNNQDIPDEFFYSIPLNQLLEHGLPEDLFPKHRE